MGIPKFFRWLSIRYPMCSQLIDDTGIPDFDAMYLDCNGIIHRACKPNEEIPPPALSDEQVFTFIFHYLDRLFLTIKPRKLFYIAIDGVAPRAKMNQQRSRRFRTAEDTLAALRKRNAGKEIDFVEDPTVFDSNAITPGTEFMEKLAKHIHYFLHDKITSDEAWREVKIIFSGPDVPGEGEHKIMDYIRRCKASEDYDPRMRHCIYGLDADLIMLGLLTHEKNVALLREEITFGRRTSAKKEPRDALSSIERQKFYLLHTCLLREYMQLEFGALDIERVIDDFVVMCFLVGNDFLPHLPNLHINEGALGMMFEAYKKGFCGYLHESGTLDLERLEAYLHRLATEFEYEVFANEKADEAYLKSKIRGKKVRDYRIKKKKPVAFEESTLSAMMVEGDENATFNTPSVPMATDTEGDVPDPHGIQRKRGTENPEEQAAFEDWKHHYYQEKLDIDSRNSPDQVRKMVKDYIEGVQWVLGYYYLGVQSWSWFYPYHYAPRISDMTNITQFRVKRFKSSKPFKPFQQLMAVLPAASRALLPMAYRSLFTKELAEYYPRHFECDLNGKKQDWEAVVKVPFISEKQLVGEMKPRDRHLTPTEKLRNRPGNDWTYEIIEEPYIYPSTMPGVLSDIAKCVVKRVEFNAPPISAPFVAHKQSARAQGFPSLYSVPFSASLTKAMNLVVFNQISKDTRPTMTLYIQDRCANIDIETLSQQLIGQVVGISWPRVEMALVRSLVQGDLRYFLREGRVQVRPLDPAERDKANFQRKNIENEYERHCGVFSGPVEVLVGASKFQGWKKLDDQSVIPNFDRSVVHVAIQTITRDVLSDPPTVGSIETEYPLRERLFCLTDEYYGCPAMVTGHERRRISLNVVKKTDPIGMSGEFARSIAAEFESRELVPAYKLGKLFSNCTNHAISRITSKFLITTPDDGKVDLGLNLKNENKKLKALGMTEKDKDGKWLYSEDAVGLVREYLLAFPQLCEGIQGRQPPDLYDLSDFPGLDLAAARAWLAARLKGITLVGLSVDSWDQKTIAKLEQPLVASRPSNAASREKCSLDLLPVRYVLKPSEAHLRLAHQTFALGDRVRIVFGNVGFGSVATVVGLLDAGMIECVLDEKHMLAGSLNGRCREYAGVRCPKDTLLNTTFKQLPFTARQDDLSMRRPINNKHKLTKRQESNSWEQQRSDVGQFRNPRMYSHVMKRGESSNEKIPKAADTEHSNAQGECGIRPTEGAIEALFRQLDQLPQEPAHSSAAYPGHTRGSAPTFCFDNQSYYLNPAPLGTINVSSSAELLSIIHSMRESSSTRPETSALVRDSNANAPTMRTPSVEPFHLPPHPHNAGASQSTSDGPNLLKLLQSGDHRGLHSATEERGNAGPENCPAMGQLSGQYGQRQQQQEHSDASHRAEKYEETPAHQRRRKKKLNRAVVNDPHTQHPVQQHPSVAPTDVRNDIRPIYREPWFNPRKPYNNGDTAATEPRRSMGGKSSPPVPQAAVDPTSKPVGPSPGDEVGKKGKRRVQTKRRGQKGAGQARQALEATCADAKAVPVAAKGAVLPSSTLPGQSLSALGDWIPIRDPAILSVSSPSLQVAGAGRSASQTETDLKNLLGITGSLQFHPA